MAHQSVIYGLYRVRVTYGEGRKANERKPRGTPLPGLSAREPTARTAELELSGRRLRSFLLEMSFFLSGERQGACKDTLKQRNGNWRDVLPEDLTSVPQAPTQVPHLVLPRTPVLTPFSGFLGHLNTYNRYT